MLQVLLKEKTWMFWNNYFYFFICKHLAKWVSKQVAYILKFLLLMENNKRNTKFTSIYMNYQ